MYTKLVRDPKFVDAEKVDRPNLCQAGEMACWNRVTYLGCHQSAESVDW